MVPANRFRGMWEQHPHVGRTRRQAAHLQQRRAAAGSGAEQQAGAGRAELVHSAHSSLGRATRGTARQVWACGRSGQEAHAGWQQVRQQGAYHLSSVVTLGRSRAASAGQPRADAAATPARAALAARATSEAGQPGSTSAAWLLLVPQAAA